MRVVIVDDEELSLKRLNRLLSGHANIEICGAFLNPEEALQFAETNHVDAAFLDITMPNINGMSLSEQLRHKQPNMAIALVTGYDEYAVKAYEMDILDYMIKPVTADRLERTIARLLRHKRYMPAEQPNDKSESRLTVALFGGVSLYKNADQAVSIKLRSPKTEELLAFLVCKKTVSRDEAVDTLWGDLPPEKAWKNLNSTLYYIRRALNAAGFSQVLATDRNMIHIQSDELNCDFYEFERLLQQAKQATESDTALYRRLDALYDAEFLKGRSYDWASQIANLLQYNYIEALEQASRQYNKRGEHVLTLYYYERIIKLDELREDIHRKMISLYTALGRTTEARRQYSLLEELMLRELGSSPDSPGIEH